MARQNNYQQQPQNRSNMIMSSGEASYVSAEMLKQVSVPVEALLGTLNGAVSGAIMGSAVSAVVTYAGTTAGKTGLREVAKNIVGGHGLAVLAGTTALGALGGIVRYSRALKHNEWSDRHYAHLEHQQTQPAAQQEGGFAGRVIDSREQADQAVTR